jgi:hypothetical protein
MTLTALILAILLGHPRFTVREFAHQRLAIIAEYVPSIVFKAESSPDPEVACRAKLIGNRLIQIHARELLARELPSNWPCFPWIEGEICQIHTDEWLKKAAVSGRSSDEKNWLQWREACEQWLMAQLCMRAPVRATIAALCEAEMVWCRLHGKPIPPVPTWK